MSYRNAKEFFEDAKRNGLGPDEAKEAYQSYVSEGGSFSGGVDVTQPEPQQEQPKPSKPASLGGALFPSFTEASNSGQNLGDLVQEKQGGGGVIRKGLGLGSDLVSGLLRVPMAAARTLDSRMGFEGTKPQTFTESLDQINQGKNLKGQESFIADLERDPATIPSLLVGGGSLGTLKSMAVGGAKIGAMNAALHQGDKYARTGTINPGEATAEVAINAALPIATKGIGKVIKSGVGGVKTILSKFSGIDEEALKAGSNPEFLKNAKSIVSRTGKDLSGVADDLQIRLGQVADDEANAISAVNAKRQETLQRELLTARPGEPIPSLNDVSQFNSGMRIQNAAQGADAAAGRQFGEAQSAILDAPSGGHIKPKKGRPAPSRPTIGTKGVKFGGPEGDQNTFELAIDGFLNDAGVGKGGKQYGVIGNVSIPQGAINEIRNMKEVFKTALNTRDFLDQLRLVDNRINFGGTEGGRLFARGSQEDLAIKQVRARLDDALEEQIANAAGKEKGKILAAWQAHREAFSNTRKALETIQDGLGSPSINQESYINRIKNIGIDDLRKISAQAQNDPNIAPVWEELRKGFYDGIIAKGVKEDGVDFKAMKKVWDSLDEDLKLTMMPYQVAAHIDDVLGRAAPIDFAGQKIADVNRIATKDRQALIGTLENAGSKAKRTDLRDLETLDDLLGLQGKDRFSEQAKSFYLGKQLGMTEKGVLPKLTGIQNGASLKSLLLATTGGAIGGSQGGTEGAGIGTTMGLVAGIALQSPAGALAAYKLLNNLRGAAITTERKLLRPAARAGLSSGRVGRVLTTPLHSGDQ